MRRFAERCFPIVKAISPRLARTIWRRVHCSVRARLHGAGNVLRYESAVLRAVDFRIEGSRNVIEIGDGAHLQNVTFYIRGDDHRIVIGRGCRFNRGGNIWFEDHHGQLTIGDESSFEDVHIAVTEPHSSVSIGRDCMFAYDIDLRTGDSHAILDRHTGERVNAARDICFGDHVWVAAHCRILKGVSIASDSVIGSGSVVTKSCDTPGVILAGNPARVVRDGITWSRDKFGALPEEGRG